MEYSYKDVRGRRPLHQYRNTSISPSPNLWSNMEKSKSQEDINTTSDEENPQLLESAETLNPGVEIDKKTTFDHSSVAGSSNLQGVFNLQDSSNLQSGSNLQGGSNLQDNSNLQGNTNFQDDTNLQGGQNVSYWDHQTNFQSSGQEDELDYRRRIVEDATRANIVFSKSNSSISLQFQRQSPPQRRRAEQQLNLDPQIKPDSQRQPYQQGKPNPQHSPEPQRKSKQQRKPDSQWECESQRKSEPQRKPGQQLQSEPQQMSIPHYQPESAMHRNVRGEENTSDAFSILFVIVFIIIAVVIGCTISPNYKEDPKPARKDCSFDSIKKEFPSEEIELWKSLKIGTDRIIKNNPAVPSVYLFLHSNGSAPQKLIRKIAQTAADCLDPPRNPVVLDRQDFTSEESIKDYGQIIKKFKERIGEEGGALIVANLNEIPGEAALALHFICDTYSPIVSKLLIFMTLVTAKDQVRTPIEIAEHTLYHLWSSNINPNELDPLIARVTDQVFQIHTV